MSPDQATLAEFLEAAGGTLKIVALAPEIPSAETAVEELNRQGIQVAMGHSNAGVEQVSRCIDAGANIAVHLFNGMSGLHHREPGCVGAFLKSDRVFTEIIADGIHVHPLALKLAWKCKGADKMLLISDGICAGGLPDGGYVLGELQIQVKDGVARTDSGSLAGSTQSLNYAIRTMVEQAGVPEIDAIKMASQTPAGILGIDHRLGCIESGKEASLIVTDQQYNVELTLVKGQPVFCKQGK